MQLRNSAAVPSSAFVAVSIVSILYLESSLWGLSSWHAVSPTAAIFSAVAVLAIVMRKSPLDPFRSTRCIENRALRIIAIAALTIVILHLLRSKHYLWGGGAALGAAIEQGRLLPAGPLGSFIHLLLYRFANTVFLLNSRETIALTAIATGTLFVFVSMRAASIVFQEEEERELRRLAAAAMVASGFAIVFLEGGNAAFAALLGAAFLVSSLEFTDEKCSFAVPTAFFAAATLSHISALCLLPGFIYLTFGRTNRGRLRKTLSSIGILGTAWIAVEICCALSKHIGPGKFLIAFLAGSSNLTLKNPLSEAKTLFQSLNGLLLIGPSSIAAVFMLASSRCKGKNRENPDADRAISRFLSVSTIGSIALALAAGNAVDRGLRWDVLACAGQAPALYALWKISTCAESLESARKLLSTLFILGLFHTVPLVLIDNVSKFAEKRILDLPLAAGLGEMIIAEDAEARADIESAKRWYEASLSKNPANPAVESRLGSFAMKEEEYAAAISHYLNAHELDRENTRYRLELAEALIGKGWFPEAIAQLETLTASHPDSVLFWRRLGFASNNGMRFERAIAAYERALELEPQNEVNTRNLVSALLNRGAELQKSGLDREARSLYEKAISLLPDDWHAYNNLAVMEMKTGNYKKAEEILRQVMTLYPYEATLHMTLGLVLEKTGRLSEALEHLRESLELDPMTSKARPHIERITEKLAGRCTDQGDSQRKPLNSP